MGDTISKFAIFDIEDRKFDISNIIEAQNLRHDIVESWCRYRHVSISYLLYTISCLAKVPDGGACAELRLAGVAKLIGPDGK